MRLIILTILISIGLVQTTFAQVPNEYKPNYKFQQQRDGIQESLIKLSANKKIGNPILPTEFSTLNSNFQTTFVYLPKKPEYKFLYEQCLAISQKLSVMPDFNGPRLDDLESFFTDCSQGLQKVILDIQSFYTVKAAILVSPKSGSAPLNVTLDARTSKDTASNETIPESNYFWYYRDSDGIQKVIGKGAVKNFTFDKEGNYVVHLTVRSANNETKGVFDGEANTTIDVAPEAAVVAVYVNGVKLKDNKIHKIGTAEAQKGLVIDGSPTIAQGGRKILSYSREITGPQGYQFTDGAETEPGSITVQLPNNGEYKVSLSVNDNENNSLKKTYRVLVSDPVAVLKKEPIDGDTSTTYNFDAGSSYSVVSNIKGYQREFYDGQGNLIEPIQGKSTKRQFTIPGTYKAQLSITDESNQRNTDQIQFYVDSTPPKAQFKIEPLAARKYPSQFILDASASYDPDVFNQTDELRYERGFTNAEKVNVDKELDLGKKIYVTFNEKGTYKVRLRVIDKYGKVDELEKDLKIESAIRPQMLAAPIATTLGRRINFIVRSNQSIANYFRDFGDKTTRTLQTDRITHIYDKVGEFEVLLRVTAPGGEENEIKRTIFIGEKDQPVAGYDLIVGANIVSKNTICKEKFEGVEYEYNAYTIDRLKTFGFDISESTNIKGEKANLKYYFQPKGGDISTKQSFTYNFKDLGCQYIDYTVEDSDANKSDRRRIRFKVVNAKPTIDNLIILFPQYGNEVGVGIGQDKQKDIFKIQYDPLIVKVNAQGTRDPDGNISYYKRYYYNKDDPDRKLEIKTTPANIPYVYFSVPAVPGEFVFGVDIIDNDNDVTISDNEIGQGPVVFFPPDSKNIDIPLATLNISPINAKVGEDVTFTVESKVLSNRADFEATRSIKYDFDGDGERDLTTKEPKVIFVYKKPTPTEETADGRLIEVPYKPRAQVIYRGYPGTAVGEGVIVKNGLRPQVLLDSYGSRILVRNVSIGDVKDFKFCLDFRKCADDPTYIKENENTFLYDYKEPGKYVVKFDLSDDYGNSGSFQQVLDLQPLQEPSIVHLMSVPVAKVSNNAYNIAVGNSLENTITYNVVYGGTGQCYVDIDISVDTDSNGNTQNDKDFSCGEIITHTYQPQFESMIGRIYFQLNNVRRTQDINVNFLDFTVEIPDNLKDTYNKIGTLITTIEVGRSANTQFLKDELVKLRNSLTDKLSVSSSVVTINGLLEQKDITLTEVQKQLLNDVLLALSSKATSAALQGTPYENAKNGILFLLPPDAKPEARRLFQLIESANGDKDKIKGTLEDVLKLVNQQIVDGKMIPEDLNEVRKLICDIVINFEIPSERCVVESGDDLKVTAAASSSSSIVRTIVKRILFVVGLLAGGFVLLVVIFAIKAKIQEKK